MNHPAHPFLALRRLWLGAAIVLTLTACKLVQSATPAQPTASQAPAVVASPGAPVTKPATRAAPASPAASEAAIPETPEQAASDPAAAVRPQARPALEPLAAAPRYQIALDLGPDGSIFHGRQTTQVTNQEDTPLDQLYFRLLPNGGKSYGNGSLTVQTLRLNGQAIQPAPAQDTSVLEVLLPQPLAPGQVVRLDFDFEGKVPQDFDGGYGIYNFTENVLSLADAYPILAVYDADGWNLDPVSSIGDSVYSDMAFYSVQVCAPAGWRVAATGAAIAAPGSDPACTHFESGPVREFFLTASPDFQVVEAAAEDVTVRSLYLPGEEAAGRKTLAIAVDALGVFNRRFGAYPYTELEVVEMPLRYALGVEYPGIVLIGAELYPQSDEPEYPMTIAHEVAHQWWYNTVGNDVFDDPWLDEGLTTYASSLYFEDTGGPGRARGYLDFWNQRWENLREAGQDEPITQSLDYFERLPDQGRAYSTVVYVKSALFFDALRQEIGDTAFFAGLQQYYQTYQFKIASDEDLQAVFEQTSGRSLDDFYQQWLYSKQNR